MDKGAMGELLRTSPIRVQCVGRSFIHLKQHGEVFHRMGLNIRQADVRRELLVCRGCGRMDWFVPNPELLWRTQTLPQP